ncbi:MAG: glycosyltransferase [Lentisphaerota bacterium]
MNSIHIRLLYLPNEGKKNGRQTEGRVAFEKMLEAGELQAYEVFSFWDELESGLTPAEVHEKLFQKTCSFQPHILLWQHPTYFPVSTDAICRIKQLNPSPLIVYDERDAYIWPQKSLPEGAKNLARGCDVVFSSGLTTTGTLLAKAGARRVFYSPTAMDLERFATDWSPTCDREYDVVMISSISRFRYPLLRIPGTKERYLLAEKLYQVIGNRLAVFGHGWPKRPYVKGPLDFEQQTETIRSSWVSVCYDRCPANAYYFSDRLPISMMAGVAHVTNYKPGFEHLFKNGIELFYAQNIDAMVAAVQYILSLSIEERIAIGSAGAEYTRKNLDSKIVFRQLIQRCVEELALRRMS